MRKCGVEERRGAELGTDDRVDGGEAENGGEEEERSTPWHFTPSWTVDTLPLSQGLSRSSTTQSKASDSNITIRI